MIERLEAAQVDIDVLQDPVSAREHREVFDLMHHLTSKELQAARVRKNVNEIVESKEQELFVARHLGRIIGMATLTRKTIPSERTAYIDDVVVDLKYVGQGIGRRLVQSLLDLSDKEKRKVQLTSHPKRRTVAVEMYKRLGFAAKDTTFFERTPGE